MNAATRAQAIAIATAIFAARDLARVSGFVLAAPEKKNADDPRDPRAAGAIEEAVSKARFFVEVIERKLSTSSDTARPQFRASRAGATHPPSHTTAPHGLAGLPARNHGQKAPLLE